MTYLCMFYYTDMTFLFYFDVTIYLLYYDILINLNNIRIICIIS